MPKILYAPLTIGRKYWVNSVPLPNTYSLIDWSAMLDSACRALLGNATTPDNTRCTVFNYGWARYTHRVYSTEAYLLKPTDPITGEMCYVSAMWESDNPRIDYVGVTRTTRSGREYFTPIVVNNTNNSGCISVIQLVTKNSEYQGCVVVQYERIWFYIDPTTWQLVHTTNPTEVGL